MSRRTNYEIEQDYLRWLEPQLKDEFADPSRSYWGLVNLMYETPFTWIDPMDDNRLQDGLELRNEFARETRLKFKGLRPGSFLEVLIGLSRRMAFAAGGNAPGWAWELLRNLELTHMYDPLTPGKRRKAEDVMYVAMNRTYLPDGTGGFFPLQDADGDQTRVEIWYQMHSFIAELHPEY